MFFLQAFNRASVGLAAAEELHTDIELRPLGQFLQPRQRELKPKGGK